MSDDAAVTAKHLSRQEAEQIDVYWRAANYLTVGQIRLLDGLAWKSMHNATGGAMN